MKRLFKREGTASSFTSLGNESVIKEAYLKVQEKKLLSQSWEERWGVLTSVALFLFKAPPKEVIKASKVTVIFMPENFSQNESTGTFTITSTNETLTFKVTEEEEGELTRAESFESWKAAFQSSQAARWQIKETFAVRIIHEFDCYCHRNNFVHTESLLDLVLRQIDDTSPVRLVRVGSWRFGGSIEKTAKSYYEDLSNFHFEIFKYSDACGPKTLQLVSLSCLHALGLTTSLGFQKKQFIEWISDVEKGYISSNPFHTATHASDVTQTMFFFLHTCGLKTILQPEEILACILAAAAHDIRHPGFSNPYIAASKHELASRYSTPILENYHADQATKLLAESRCQFLDKERMNNLSALITELILATDLGKHFSTRGELSELLNKDNCDFSDPKVRLLLMRCAIHCSDISNPTKNWNIYREWCHRLMQEFYHQGDEEKKKGLNISLFMNRADGRANTLKCQSGFMDTFVIPLFGLWSSFFKKHFPQSSASMDTVITSMNENKRHLVDLIEKPDLGGDHLTLL